MQVSQVTAEPSESAPVKFEVQVGPRRISCTVTDEALEVASGLTLPSTSALRRRSFDRFRMLIDAAAKFKIEALPAVFPGPLAIGIADLRRVPPPKGVPLLGTSSRHMEKTA